MVNMQILLNDVVLLRKQVNPAQVMLHEGDVVKVHGAHYVVRTVRWTYGAGLSGMHVVVEELT